MLIHIHIQPSFTVPLVQPTSSSLIYILLSHSFDIEKAWDQFCMGIVFIFRFQFAIESIRISATFFATNDYFSFDVFDTALHIITMCKKMESENTVESEDA